MRFPRILLALAPVAAATLCAAQPLPAAPQELPPDTVILVQSELDYLERAGELIALELNDVAPRTALQRIGRAAGLDVVVRGPLPSSPKLTRSFRDVPVKTVLEWFSSQIPVTFKAERGDRLVVVYVQRETP